MEEEKHLATDETHENMEKDNGNIVNKDVYFTTKHVKRVHIRCRCTF
jgi:hypothetical protein